MDDAEKNRLRSLIKAKRDEFMRKSEECAANKRVERGAEAQRRLDEIASQIRITQTGPDEYHITADVQPKPEINRPLSELTPLFSGRMIKRILVALPDGAFIHSNCFHSDYTPILAETIGDAASREELWQRIRRKGLSGTRFHVYRDEEAYHLSNALQGRPFR